MASDASSCLLPAKPLRTGMAAYRKVSLYDYSRPQPYRTLRIVVNAAGALVGKRRRSRHVIMNRSGHIRDTGALEDDCKKIRGDWKAVGNDLRAGIEQYAEALTEEQRKKALGRH